MHPDFNALNKLFLEKGFFIYKNKFEKKFILKLIEDISKAENTIKYYDNFNNLRRIEKLYNKDVFLNLLNEKILKLFKEIFNKEFTIFKDKFNAKPPNGEGFFAHYDGVFKFIDENNKKKNGWYEYGDCFISALVALDDCNEKNGTIEVAKSHEGDFEKLLANTRNDGTPALNKNVEEKTNFEYMNLNIGDLLIFSNKCPHRSKKNNSAQSRRILYYTYTPLDKGSKYDLYFEDIKKSKNTQKALVDEK